MLLGAALVLVGGAVLYYAVTGNDPRQVFTAPSKKTATAPGPTPAATSQRA